VHKRYGSVSGCRRVRMFADVFTMPCAPEAVALVTDATNLLHRTQTKRDPSQSVYLVAA
jgi:hypothetical protein